MSGALAPEPRASQPGARGGAGRALHAPVRRIESSVAGRGGLRLFRRAWLPPRAERALLVVHGFAEHSGRYDRLGSWFAARGFAVHAYDHRGHGRSEGTRTHVDHFADLLDDLDAVLAQIRDEHADLPLVLLGHSMGGLVVAEYLAERAPPSLHAAVTSGAALALSPDVGRGRVLAARMLRRVAPRARLGSGLDPQGLSRDPDVVRRYVDDPLVHRSMTVSLANELLAAVARAAAACDRVRVPWLLLHGEADPICPVGASRAARTQAPEAELRTYAGLRHEIFNEPEHEQVFEDVQAWLDGLGAGPSA